MAKGQTTQPLVIWVAAEWFDRPEVVNLITVGHTVKSVDFVVHPDLILHPAAWRWGEWAWPYLNQAIREARRAKRAQEARA